MNRIRSLLVSAPAMLREQTTGLDRAALLRTLARLRPGVDLSRPLAAARAALRRLVRRHQAVDEEITELNAEIVPLVKQAAPALLKLFGVGPETAGQLLASAGDNPERMRLDERTRAYVERRTEEGLKQEDNMRCRKRFVAREVYRALPPHQRNESLKPISLLPLDKHRSIPRVFHRHSRSPGAGCVNAAGRLLD
ncbi:hypothetical protein [Streptomyces sp. WG5]|uniref:hypothetical protein n=1 Tax=Streptomyces sp. WG5 TaxID=3417648 RepID=UPI003CF9303A